MLPRLLSALALTLGFSLPVVLAAPAPRSWEPNPFAPLTPERIATLPADQRPAWEAYWAASDRLASDLPARPAADTSSLKPMSSPPKGGIHSKGLRLKAPDPWFASEEAQTIADRIAAAQMKVGAWPKGVDYTQPADTPDVARLRAGGATFDNDATISELRFLGRVIAASGAEQARGRAWFEAFERGLRYVFAAQYPNGGFPQFYPLIGGYHDGITFNDDAMTNVLELLRDVALDQRRFGFASPDVRREATDRLERGVACVLATQLRAGDERRTVWAQQYDPLTLRPAAARNFEPIADASRESAGIVLFLMSLPDPSADVVAAVDGAVEWFRQTALRDLKIRRAPADVRGEVVPAPGAPPLWARFYEPGTATPIFGDRDRTIHYDLAEISSERVAGYAWYTGAPNKVLERYDSWRKSR